MARKKIGKKKPDTGMPTFLTQWRDFRGLTQQQLAEKARLSAPAISMYETAKVMFKAESLRSLCEALECSPAELIGVDPYKAGDGWTVFRAIEALDPEKKQQILSMLRAYLALDRQ